MDIGTGIPLGSLILIAGAFALRLLPPKSKGLDELKKRVVYKDVFDVTIGAIKDDVSEIKTDVKDLLKKVK